MKHLLKTILIALILLCGNNAWAVYVNSMPVNKIQPNGDTVHFFVTGDEFYHRYHDADNYTIVQNQAGYWVYAESGEDGNPRPSQYLVATVNPSEVGLTSGISITKNEYSLRRKAWDIPEQYQRNTPKTDNRNHGDFCNLVIFIRFADDSNYSRSLQNVDHMFSDSSKVSSNSVYSYFKRASYNQLFIRTYYAPTPDSNTILSYQDSHPRAYYMPYSDNNPLGYTNYSDRTQREFDLLVGAVNWINDSAPVPTSYNLDCNNDGDIDNVNFVVRGTYTGWSDLLWPHKWNLYGHNVTINGKLVNTFNFALEGAGDDYFGPSTFSHEMFHSLGAPDLYHYNTGTEISPVGSWDLMASNSKPPQHSTAYVKWKYGNWIDSIPLITTPGTYTLSSVGDSVPGTMALRFPSEDPDQFYVVEYRDNTEIYETKLSGKGLLVYRIDTRYNGNSNWDGEEGNEIWVFRPNSTNDNETGSLSEAFLCPSRNRTEFSPSALMFPFLADGTPDCSFSISNITTPGNTCSFRYTYRTVPAKLSPIRITSQSATLTWRGNGKGYRVRYRRADSGESYTTLLTKINHITLTGLNPNEKYEWSVRALYGLNPEDSTYSDSSLYSSKAKFHTELCNNSTLDTIGWYTNEESNNCPFQYNQNYNYTQIIYPADQMGGAKNISSITLHYAHTTDLDKPNCTIYLAHTDKENFNNKADLVPSSELTQVFTGDLHFTLGWNEIVLDEIFQYNGTDNLILAIDDNSGTPSRAGEKFYTHNTDSIVSVVYAHNNVNPGPEQDSIVGTRNNHSLRPNIKFSGCPIDSTHYYACIISENDAYGTVTGGGLYEPYDIITIQAFPKANCTFTQWHDGKTNNPRTLVMRSDTLIIAFFESHVGINEVEEQGGYVVMTQNLNITIQGAENKEVQVFDVMGRHIASFDPHHSTPLTCQLPHRGIYLLRIGKEKPIKLLVN